MEKLIRKKIVLSLLDNDSKSANEIVNEVGEPQPTVEDQLPTLVSENICEKVNQNDVDQYFVRKDIPTFAHLVKMFLSDIEEQIERFITSDYYFNRIDEELIDYVLKRYYLDSTFQTDEEKLVIKKILLVSPSALFFALYGDTRSFSESWNHLNQLKPSDVTREWLTQILHSQFITALSNNLIADMQIPAYCILYAKLGVRVALVNTQVRLATIHEKFVEAVGEQYFSLFKAAEDLRAGQLTSAVNPMVFSEDGSALIHLGEFQAAYESFNKALDSVNDPKSKAIIFNNKGIAFLRSKQYQKAIECFEKGIEFDTEVENSVLPN